MGKMSRKCVEQFGERVNEHLWHVAEKNGIKRNSETIRKLGLCDLAAAHVAFDDGCGARPLSHVEIDEVESLGEAFFALATAFSAQRNASSFLREGNVDAAQEALMLALLIAGFGLGRVDRHTGGDVSVLMSELGRKGALALHENDPRQFEKTFVKECWDAWRAHPENYPSKAEFARDMILKCSHLKSQTVIERWCRAWEKTTTHSR